MKMYCQWCEKNVKPIEHLWCWVCSKCYCTIKNKFE